MIPSKSSVFKKRSAIRLPQKRSADEAGLDLYVPVADIGVMDTDAAFEKDNLVASSSNYESVAAAIYEIIVNEEDEYYLVNLFTIMFLMASSACKSTKAISTLAMLHNASVKVPQAFMIGTAINMTMFAILGHMIYMTNEHFVPESKIVRSYNTYKATIDNNSDVYGSFSDDFRKARPKRAEILAKYSRMAKPTDISKMRIVLMLKFAFYDQIIPVFGNVTLFRVVNSYGGMARMQAVMLNSDAEYVEILETNIKGGIILKDRDNDKDYFSRVDFPDIAFGFKPRKRWTENMETPATGSTGQAESKDIPGFEFGKRGDMPDTSIDRGESGYGPNLEFGSGHEGGIQIEGEERSEAKEVFHQGLEGGHRLPTGPQYQAESKDQAEPMEGSIGGGGSSEDI